MKGSDLPFPLWIVRDDLFEPVTGVRGNKARKLFPYLSVKQEQRGDLILFSHGGNQSNAMAAISALAAGKQVPFVYLTTSSPIATHGNWSNAVHQGMLPWFVSSETYSRFFETRDQIALSCFQSSGPTMEEFSQQIEPLPLHLHEFNTHSVHFVPQGGAHPMAEEGMRILGGEIQGWIEKEAINEPVALCLPAGTGTTALYLAKSLEYVSQVERVIPIPCVGGPCVLRKQMEVLHPALEDISKLWFLDPDHVPRHGFGRPHRKDYAMWKQINSWHAGPEPLHLDLIYAPRSWRTILGAHDHMTDHGRLVIVYLHTGGYEGVCSQEDRYHQLGWI